MNNQRVDRGRATRKSIIETAARLFTEHGYDDTSIELVLDTCTISKGALYHHFENKRALFFAVLESTEAHVADVLTNAAKDTTDPLQALRAGSFAWLQLAQNPSVRRIVLTDAPSVIGWPAWRELGARYGLGLLKQAFGMVSAAGRMRADLVDLYAHTLLAVLTEVALMIARADDAVIATAKGEYAVEQIVSRLVGVEPNAAW